MAGTRRGEREGKWEVLCHVVKWYLAAAAWIWHTCNPLPKNCGSIFFACVVLSCAFPSLPFCLRLRTYWLRPITELIWLKIMLLLGWFSVRFPHLYWQKEGDGSIHLGQDWPFWQQQALRSAYGSCGSTPSESRSEWINKTDCRGLQPSRENCEHQAGSRNGWNIVVVF